jgi:hypothetical protein
LIQKKPNPLEAAIALVGKPGEPDIAIGKTTFHVLHVEGNRALLAGALLDHSGRRIGKVEIDGFPAGDLPAFKPAGRPKSDEKHMAVFLAWALRCAELGGKMGEADTQTASYFKYSEGKKVRDIRQKLAAKIGLDLTNDAIHIADSSGTENPLACSVLIENPTIYATKTGGVEILGFGVGWIDGMGERVISRRVFRVEVEEVDSAFDLAALKEKKGPIIISVIRPGR